MAKIPLKEMTYEQAIDIAKEIIKGKHIIGNLDTDTTIRILELLIEKIETKG